MLRRITLLAVLGSLTLSACARAPEATSASEAAPAPGLTPGVQRATASPIKPLAQKKFGGAITETTSTALDTLLKDGVKYQSKTVRTEGVVSAVCKSMGCWM